MKFGEDQNNMLLNKMKKIEKNKLDVRRSDEKLQKTLQDWGTSKAQREKQSLAKIDTKAMMEYTARDYTNKFKLKVKKHQTKYFNISKKKLTRLNSIDSDTSLSANEGAKNKFEK